MATQITTRLGKGAALTYEEADANFTNLRDTADKAAAILLTSRANLPASGVVENGVTVLAGGLAYTANNASTVIPDKPGWVPAGDVTPQHFGAVGDGIEDDTAAVQGWASTSGRLYHPSGVYAISTMIGIASDRVEGSGTFLWIGAAEGEMFDFTVSSTRWVGGEIDGNLLAKTGIRSLTVGGHDIEGVEIHGMRSTTSVASGVKLEGAVGSRVAGCVIYDMFSSGNSTSGDANGPSRAIYASHDEALTEPHIWENNVIHDIWGEEGDGVQILLFDGTYPFLSSARSTIRNNRIYGCGRRAVKIQASNVIVSDNDLRVGGGSPPPSQASQLKLSVLNVILSSGCIVSRNIIRGSDGYVTLSVTGSSGLPEPSGTIIDGNDIIGPSDNSAVFIDRIKEFSFSSNKISGGTVSLAVGNSTRGAIWSNQFIGSTTSGSNADIFVTNSCSEISVRRNIGLGGSKNTFISATAPLSDYSENAVFRDAGNGVVVSGTIEATVNDTLLIGSGDPVQSSIDSARIGPNVNLGSGTGGFGASLFWSNGDPTTVRASRKHKIGDIAFNTTAGATVGWRCTVSGIPGTWVAFS